MIKFDDAEAQVNCRVDCAPVVSIAPGSGLPTAGVRINGHQKKLTKGLSSPSDSESLVVTEVVDGCSKDAPVDVAPGEPSVRITGAASAEIDARFHRSAEFSGAGIAFARASSALDRRPRGCAEGVVEPVVIGGLRAACRCADAIGAGG